MMDTLFIYQEKMENQLIMCKFKYNLSIQKLMIKSKKNLLQIKKDKLNQDS